MKKLLILLLLVCSTAFAIETSKPTSVTVNTTGTVVGDAITGGTNHCVLYDTAGFIACGTKIAYNSSTYELTLAESGTDLSSEHHIAINTDSSGANWGIILYDQLNNKRVILKGHNWYGLIVNDTTGNNSCNVTYDSMTCGDSNGNYTSITATTLKLNNGLTDKIKFNLQNGDINSQMVNTVLINLVPTGGGAGTYCGVDTEGNIYNDSSHALCWCDGTTWTKIAGAGSCSDPGE